jgi:hypothetical protein
LIDRASVEAVLNTIPDPATGQGLMESGLVKGLTRARFAGMCRRWRRASPTPPS